MPAARHAHGPIHGRARSFRPRLSRQPAGNAYCVVIAAATNNSDDHARKGQHYCPDERIILVTARRKSRGLPFHVRLPFNGNAAAEGSAPKSRRAAVQPRTTPWSRLMMWRRQRGSFGSRQTEDL
jgi:hypothetical protein